MRPSGWLARWIGIGLVTLGAIAGCGSNDDPYSGVLEWRCFDRIESCSCAGLRSGQESAGSNPVASCSGSFCKTYLERDRWSCECRDEDWDPSETATDPITERHEVVSCPP
jgi:hypothetical protein